MPGRTDNQIKNRYNSNLKKRLSEPEFAQIISGQEALPLRSESSSNPDPATLDAEVSCYTVAEGQSQLTLKHREVSDIKDVVVSTFDQS